MNFKWPPLWNDFGVSALLTTVATLGTILILVKLGLSGQVDDALKLSGVMVAMTYKFWDGYLSKRKEDEERRERMTVAGNGNTPRPPGGA